MDGNSGRQTIAAISTPPGIGGLCVMRISGPDAWTVGDRLLPPRLRGLASRPPNTFFHAPVLHPETGGKIDDALFLIFRAPRSYTGEDTLEVQGHGGLLQPRRILEAALAAGARLARPGEFSQRAFLNGRMDLARAEAVCDLIHARSERAAGLARTQLDGALGRQTDAAYDRLLSLGADIEHILDFDEGDVPGDFLPRTAAALADTLRALRTLADTSREGLMMREGALVVISGRPNAGKSSLMNALLRRDRAIVHAEPGTTRDVIEEPYELDGMLLRLMDTAGLRDAAGEVEREGISRAREWISRADLNLHLVDRSAAPPQGPAPHPLRIPGAGKTLILLTKCDLPPAPGFSPRAPEGAAGVLSVSSKTGEGLDALKRTMLAALGVSPGGPPSFAVSLRHGEELRRAVRDGSAALAALGRGPEGLVPAAIHLRAACEAVGRITGRVYTDDLLDRVFSRFCIGK